MKFKIYVMSSILLILLLISCMDVITTSPPKKNLIQRLKSFPTSDLPLKDGASIYWDSHLIPFIEAKTDEDCAFLLGMVHAHLRLGQMTLIRRVVEGRLAESAGPFATSIDHSLRIVNLAAAVDSIETILPGDTKSWLQNYANGINFYQEKMIEKPIEFKLLSIKPDPWQVRDVLIVGRLASADVNWFNWFQWLKLRDKPYWQELWKRFLELGFHSTPSFKIDMNFISSGIKSGSNAFVISADRSADSNAVLATDPHLGLQLPNTWLITGYKCPSFHVVGFMFPGVPMVLVGRNESIAWGGTNMRSASSDLYELNSEQLENLKTRTEKIKVRWWKDKEVEIRMSDIGPVLSDIPFFKNNKRIFAMKWVGHQATDEYSSFYRLNKATDWNEFRNAFKSYGVSGQNFLYADNEGHIGMVPAVKIPNRQQLKPDDFLLNPDNPQLQWNNLIGTLELPYVFDPAEGFIVSANNRPFVHNPPMGYFFSANDRVDRLTELFRQNEKVDLDFIKQTQRDAYVISAVRLRDVIIDKIEGFNLIDLKDRQTEEFLNLLRQWDGNYHVESKGAVAFQMLIFHLIQDYYTKIYDEDFARSLLSSEHAITFLGQDLRKEGNENIKSILQQAIKKAIKDSRKYKNWGEMHRLNVRHILGRIPIIGGRYRFGNYPAAGSYNSAMKTAHEISNKKHDTFYGANSRFIAMMRDMDENYFVLLGGQDGWLGSESFVDQVPLWLEGEYIQIPLRIDNVQKFFPNQMQLRSKTGY
jgi:penicillin amidase